MRIQNAARHCEVPTPVRDRTEEQLGKLSRYEPRLSGAEVVFEIEQGPHALPHEEVVVGEEHRDTH